MVQAETALQADAISVFKLLRSSLIHGVPLRNFRDGLGPESFRCP